MTKRGTETGPARDLIRELQRIDQSGEPLSAELVATLSHLREQVRVYIGEETCPDEDHAFVIGDSLDEFCDTHTNIDNTRNAYRAAIERLIEWCREEGLTIDQLHYRQAAQYIAWLRRKYKITTVRLNVTAIRVFCDFLMHQGTLQANPIPMLRLPDKRQPDVLQHPSLTLAEVRKLFGVFNPKKPIEARDRAMIGTMLYTCAQVRAITKLTVADYLQNQQGLRLEVSGHDIAAPLHPEASEMLDDYLRVVPFRKQESYVLFPPTNRGGKWVNRPMKSESVGKVVKRATKRAKMSKSILPIQVRLTGISALIQAGCTYKEIWQFTGPKAPETMQEYEQRATSDDPNLSSLFEDFDIVSSPLRRYIETSGIFRSADTSGDSSE